MRTLVIINSLKVGGMERVAINLADAMAGAGHDSHLLYFKGRTPVLLPEDPDVKVHHYNHRRALQLTIVGLLVDLISRLLLNAMFRRSHFIWVGWLTGWLFKRHIRKLEKEYGCFDRLIFRGIDTFKHVWSFHDKRAVYVLESVLHAEGPAWQQRWRARLLFNHRHLVAVSGGVAAAVETAAPLLGFQPLSLRVITNPCPVARIREKMLEAQPDIPATPYLVNVSRLVPAKGHTVLLEAYARADFQERLVIVGDGPERAALVTRAQELGVADKVLFVGMKTNPYPWMYHARLFVLSSNYEGLGVVLCEALACGTPIVSVDCPGGVRDVLKGPLEQNLAPHSVDGLAEKMREVLSLPRQVVAEEWLDAFRTEVVVDAFLRVPEATGSYR